MSHRAWPALRFGTGSLMALGDRRVSLTSSGQGAAERLLSPLSQSWHRKCVPTCPARSGFLSAQQVLYRPSLHPGPVWVLCVCSHICDLGDTTQHSESQCQATCALAEEPVSSASLLGSLCRWHCVGWCRLLPWSWGCRAP